MKNLLITSAGRRVELLKTFKRELHRLLPQSKIFTIDNKPKLSAACQIADYKHSCPRVTDPQYIEFLLNHCLENDIGLVIPTIDTELTLLAKERKRFQKHGIELCISDENIVDHCQDKRITGELFQKHDISYPEIYNRNNLRFPCFAKPYNGSCSIGAKNISNRESLDNITFKDENIIFMELIDKSYYEYTIDAYFDKKSTLKCLVPRKRIEVRAGEVSKGITKKDHLYESLVSKLGKLNGARGCLTIQCFVKNDGKDYIGLEINPRFGGGYPLSYNAGANYPKWLIEEYLLEEQIDFFDKWEENLLMLRYDAEVLISNAEF